MCIFFFCFFFFFSFLLFFSFLQVASLDLSGVSDPAMYMAHTLSSLSSVVQAACNPDHQRDPAVCIVPFLPSVYAILTRIGTLDTHQMVDDAPVDIQEPLQYACEVIESLCELLGGDKTLLQGMARHPSVVAVLHKVHACPDLAETEQSVKRALKA
jgi:hypothetical protein